ncbi:MAG: parvulin peptidyl-prolyl isomerase [Ignavibacteria bacterium]|nr:parvulin peptidyl-prolyl isomerase [Ignavibacteria bacterium]
MKRTFICAAILLMITAIEASAQTVVDRIAAVVDKEIITESELLERVNFIALQNKLDSKSRELRLQVLDAMIAEKLVLAQAAIDSIEVSENEVTQALEQQIQNLVRQAGSEQRVEQYYGMPIARIKREFRDEMRKSLLVNRVRQTRESSIQVSLREVEEFYRAYKDSLPAVPVEYELSNIFIVPKPDPEIEKETRQQLAAVRDSIRKGTGDFAEMAKRYSKHATADRGGDLPWAKRGELLKEFEEVVFSLRENEVSDVFKTELGLHLVQLMERRGESVRVRQILIPLEKGTASDSAAIKKLEDLRDRAINGESFAGLAKEFSEDEDTRPYGGNLGRVSEDQLESEFGEVVKKLSEGEISLPHRVNVGALYGYQIVWLRKNIAAHPMNLEDDFRRVEQFALFQKRNRLNAEWIEQLKGRIYWEIRI